MHHVRSIRLAVNGVPLHELRRMLGQKSLAVTQKYLADVDLTQGKMRGGGRDGGLRPEAEAGQGGLR